MAWPYMLPRGAKAAGNRLGKNLHEILPITKVPGKLALIYLDSYRAASKEPTIAKAGEERKKIGYGLATAKNRITLTIPDCTVLETPCLPSKARFHP